MKKFWKLERYAPLGYDYQREMTFFLLGLVVCILFSLSFFSNQSHYVTEAQTALQLKHESYNFPSYSMVLLWSLRPLEIYGILSFGMIFLHWNYHNLEGSHPLYWMKRLPDGGELVRRCFVLPVVCGILTLGLSLGLYLLYELYYWHTIPEGVMLQLLEGGLFL